MAAYEIGEVEIWAADIPNQPGTLSRLLDTLSAAGAELEFMVARPENETTSRIFLAPIKGAKKKQAAEAAGLKPAVGLHSIRVEGPDRSGLGKQLTAAVAGEGINLRGVSAAGVGKRAIFYLAIENADAVKTARQAIKKSLSKKASTKKGGKKSGKKK